MDLDVTTITIYNQLRSQFSFLGDSVYLDEWDGAKERSIYFILEILEIPIDTWATATRYSYIGTGFELLIAHEFLNKLMNSIIRIGELGSYSSPTGESLTLQASELNYLGSLANDFKRRALEYLLQFSKNKPKLVSYRAFNWDAV